MPTDRRSFVKAGGVAAVAGITGLAGCSGDFLGGGGGGGSKNWQYDPAALVQTQNRFYGSMDYSQFYSMRDELPNSEETFQVDEDSPIKPEDIDDATGVGGAAIDLMGETATMFGSFAITGSFDKGTLEGEIESDGEANRTGEYSGYTLYENADDPTNSVGSSSSSATVGVGDDAMIIGFVGAEGTDPSITGEDAVREAIDASNGDADLLKDNSSNVRTLKDTISGKTMEVGGEIDPEIVDQIVGSGLSAQEAQFVEGARGGGFGMDVGSSTTTMEMVALYQDAQTAEDTGLKELIELGAQNATEEPGIDEVTAEYDGAAVVVTIKGDTQTIFEESSGFGGSNFDVAPVPQP